METEKEALMIVQGIADERARLDKFCAEEGIAFMYGARILPPTKVTRIAEHKEAVCEAAKAMYLTPEGERLSYIRQLGSLMLLAEALIKAEGE